MNLVFLLRRRDQPLDKSVFIRKEGNPTSIYQPCLNHYSLFSNLRIPYILFATSVLVYFIYNRLSNLRHIILFKEALRKRKMQSVYYLRFLEFHNFQIKSKKYISFRKKQFNYDLCIRQN